MSSKFFLKYCSTTDNIREFLNYKKRDLSVFQDAVSSSPNIFFELLDNGLAIIRDFNNENVFYELLIKTYNIYINFYRNGITDLMINKTTKESVLLYAYRINIKFVRMIIEIYPINTQYFRNGDTFIMQIIHNAYADHLLYFINDLNASLLVYNNQNINGLFYLLIFKRFDVIFNFKQEQFNILINFIYDNFMDIMNKLILIKNYHSIFYCMCQMEKYIELETIPIDKNYYLFYSYYQFEIRSAIRNKQIRNTVISSFNENENYNKLFEDIYFNGLNISDGNSTPSPNIEDIFRKLNLN
jgi:hypothetical protein